MSGKAQFVKTPGRPTCCLPATLSLAGSFLRLGLRARGGFRVLGLVVRYANRIRPVLHVTTIGGSMPSWSIGPREALLSATQHGVSSV